MATALTKKMLLELKSGVFADAAKLPPETELAEKLGVSRSVIRDVMSILEQKGFVERVRGVGTIVHRDIVELDNRLDLKFEYCELIRNAGFRPSCDKVRLRTRAAGDELSKRLEIKAEENVIVCEKRVLASGTPVIFSYDYLPESLFSHVDYRTLDWAEPVFNLLEGHCGIVVDVSIAKLLPTVGPREIRELMGAKEDEAFMMLDEVSYYKLSRPIIHTYAYYTSFFEFTILRKKL